MAMFVYKKKEEKGEGGRGGGGMVLYVKPIRRRTRRGG